MKHGKLLLATFGAVLVVVGVVLAVFDRWSGGVLAGVIGAVLLVLGVHDWDEFTAEAKDLRLTISRARGDIPAPTPPAPVARAPELEILSVEERGGDSRAVDFTVEVTNRGTKSCRATLAADVDGWRVECQPAALDLEANTGAKQARVLVPRPALGNLVPEFNHETTLYGRTLRIGVSADGQRVEETWREHVHSDEENSVRAEIQRRVWHDGADLHPQGHEVGMNRTRYCKACDAVTEQRLDHNQNAGDGRSIARVWRCLTCGASPA